MGCDGSRGSRLVSVTVIAQLSFRSFFEQADDDVGEVCVN